MESKPTTMLLRYYNFCWGGSWVYVISSSAARDKENRRVEGWEEPRVPARAWISAHSRGRGQEERLLVGDCR